MSSQHKGIVTHHRAGTGYPLCGRVTARNCAMPSTIQHNGSRSSPPRLLSTSGNVVRCIAMNSTDGLVRGMEAIDTGAPISVPVGEECLGRISIFWASPLITARLSRPRNAGPSTAPPPLSISSPRPRCWKPASRSSIFSPLRQGRQDRPVRRRRRRQNRPHQGADPKHRHEHGLGVHRRRRAHP